jgi:hypothetical protein
MLDVLRGRLSFPSSEYWSRARPENALLSGLFVALPRSYHVSTTGDHHVCRDRGYAGFSQR